ncbi:MAG: hypothetical protein ACRDLF_04955 [Solirubrobacteraceae bacterium]
MEFDPEKGTPMKLRLRFYGLVAIGEALIGLAIVALVPSAALATHSPASGLRHSLGQLVTALRETASPTVCSLATPAGEAALIEIVKENAPTPPGTTCQEAFVGLPKALDEEGGQRSASLVISVREMISTASLRMKGSRATARLTRDSWVTGRNGSQVTGAAAVKLDPLGLSHWIRNRQGRWMFNDQPTGPYSSAGLRAAKLISNALKGSTLRIAPPPVEITYGFCGNQATTNDTLTVFDPRPETDNFPAGQGGSWFVGGGYSYLAFGSFSVNYPVANGLDGQEAPFDAQGNPQGNLTLSPPPFEVQDDIKLVSGKVIVSENGEQGVVQRTVTPGTAGC